MPPERARAVVVGGGVIGCSCLYHLAKQGWTDSVLVEQFQLTHGSTWHSAGLVGQLRSSISLTRMMQYSVGLYAELKELTGNDPGWHQLGGLRLASSQPRLEEIRRQASWARTFGLPMEIVSAEEAQAMFPPMSTDRVLGAAFIPEDGYLDPSQLTFALADGARRLGAQIEVRTQVTGIETTDGRVSAVETDNGRIECEVVVDAAGMYARQVAALVGVDVPMIPFGHQYLITEPFDSPLDALPTLRDPDNLVYFRTEVGGLVMGGYERKPEPWAIDGIPDGFEAKLLPQDLERMEELFTNAIARVPAMETAEVRAFFNGPEAFTPDADFLLGETDVPGFWIAAGGCAHGLAGSGGIAYPQPGGPGEWSVPVLCRVSDRFVQKHCGRAVLPQEWQPVRLPLAARRSQKRFQSCIVRRHGFRRADDGNAIDSDGDRGLEIFVGRRRTALGRRNPDPRRRSERDRNHAAGSRNARARACSNECSRMCLATPRAVGVTRRHVAAIRDVHAAAQLVGTEIVGADDCSPDLGDKDLRSDPAQYASAAARLTSRGKA